jgi:hypothetical protein
VNAETTTAWLTVVDRFADVYVEGGPPSVCRPSIGDAERVLAALGWEVPTGGGWSRAGIAPGGYSMCAIVRSKVGAR